MSANNVVWYMQHDGLWHVWYSGCMDNTPKEPDINNEHYKMFKYRVDAIIYAHYVVKKIDEEAYKAGFVGVEYGVCEVPIFHKNRNFFDRGKLERIDKTINEWKQKIKDLQFSIEQFEDWKKEIIGNLGGENTGEVKMVEQLLSGEKSHISHVALRDTVSKPSEVKEVLYPGIYGYIDPKKIDCNKCELYGECDHQGAYQKDGRWCYEDSKLPEYSLTQKGLDAVNQIIKNSPQYNELKRQIYEDLLACRGMDYKEMICYILDLESKYDER